jgi:glycerol transport system ATP-binding protein
LELQGVACKVGAETHLYAKSVSSASGEINVLLGPTLSGTTTLMRLIAGLDKPDRNKWCLVI